MSEIKDIMSLSRCNLTKHNLEKNKLGKDRYTTIKGGV